MVTKQVPPKTTPGPAPRGQLTYVAIIALVVAVILLAAVIVRPMLHTGGSPQGATQGAAPAAPSRPPAS